MNPKRLYIVLIIGLLLCIGGSVAVVVLARSWLTKKSRTTVELKLDIAGLQEKQQLSSKAKSELDKYSSTVNALDNILPSEKDQPGVIVQLIKIADEVGLSFGSINFPSSDLGNEAAPKPAATDGTATTDSSGTAKKTTAPPSQAKPLEGVSGVYVVPVSLESITRQDGGALSYEQLIHLLKSLETNQRTMQISSLVITPHTTPGTATDYQVNIGMNIFIKP